MAPINLPDGSQVSEIVLPDGSTASEVLAPDGSTVFSAIPDSGDLQARFAAKDESFNDGESVTTITDQTGNGFDLTGGSPSYQKSVVNSKPVFRFDGVDDELDVNSDAISQPYSVFIVLSDNDTSSFGTAAAATSGKVRFQPGNGDFYRVTAGSRLDSGSNDGSFYIWSLVFNSSSSFARQNGTEVISGDLGSNPLDGFRIGANENNEFYFDGDIAEVLVYPDKRTTSQITDGEAYISNEYGISG